MEIKMCFKSEISSLALSGHSFLHSFSLQNVFHISDERQILPVVCKYEKLVLRFFFGHLT